MSSPELMTGLGAALAIFFSALGSSYATVYSGAYTLKAQKSSDVNFVYSFAPTIISGVLAIYGAIIAFLLYARLGLSPSPEDGYKFFSAGLTVGLGCAASGYGIGLFMKAVVTDDSAAKSAAEATEETSLLPLHTPTILTIGGFARILITLVFLEAIGLYSLIIALFLIGKA